MSFIARHIQFNVDSLWTGDENSSGNFKTMGSYQAFGELFIDLPSHTNPEEYRRSLDLNRAVHSVEYKSGGTKFLREMFCSYPAQVMVIRLRADSPGKYTGKIRLTDAHKARVVAERNQLKASGALANGLKYESRVIVLNKGGSVKADSDHVVFTGCDSLSLFLFAATDYVCDYQKKWRGAPPSERLAKQVAHATSVSYKQLKDEHIKDYQSLFNRVNLDLGSAGPDRRSRPTDQRLKAYSKDGDDRDLEEMYFQFCRYLLISCSRPGSLPANLQGVWNQSNNAPWHSDYHSNINLQMNYWSAETCNLSECHEPLIAMLNSMRGPSKKATRKEFGDVRGWTVRTSHNPFGGLGWKWNTPASAWYCQHIWEHYAFGRDPKYLQQVALPILKEVCQFWEDRLKKTPDGLFVAPKGWSPEHGPVEDGCSYDQQIIWDLFTNFIEAAEASGTEKAYAAKIAALRSKLAGPKIGKWGQLQEWMADKDNPKDHHRHVSHMFALFPGRQISPANTPKLAAAARVSLEARGFAGDVGWSNAWKTALWARLLDGEKAYFYMNRLIGRNAYPNFLNACWPGRTYQIDGNLGAPAAVAEMLMQSHAGQLQLLPALPKAWSTGEVKGLRARGGITVDIAWKGGKLTQVSLNADRSQEVKLRVGKLLKIVSLKKGVRQRLGPGLE